MKTILQTIKKKWLSWHTFNQLRVPRDNTNTTPTDLIFNAVWSLFIYVASVFVILQVGHVNYMFGLPLAFIGSLLIGFMGYRYTTKRYLDEKYSLSRQLYKMNKKLHDISVSIALTFELFIVYLISSIFIPGAKLSLQNDGYTAVSGGQYVFIVGFVFIILQPIFEGLVVRGFVTEISEKIFSTKYSYMKFLFPVLVGVILHVFGSFTFPLIYFGFVQSLFYQWLMKHYNISVSIKINVLVNIFIFGLL